MEREKGEFGTMSFIKIGELTKDNGDVVLLIRNLISQSHPRYLQREDRHCQLFAFDSAHGSLVSI